MAIAMHTKREEDVNGYSKYAQWSPHLKVRESICILIKKDKSEPETPTWENTETPSWAPKDPHIPAFQRATHEAAETHPRRWVERYHAHARSVGSAAYEVTNMSTVYALSARSVNCKGSCEFLNMRQARAPLLDPRKLEWRRWHSLWLSEL